VLHWGGEGSTASNGFWACVEISSPRGILPYLFLYRGQLLRDLGSFPFANAGREGISKNLAGYKNLKIFEADGTDLSRPAKISQAIRGRRAGRPTLTSTRLQGVPSMEPYIIGHQAYKSDGERGHGSQADPLNHLKKFLPALNWREMEKETNPRSSRSAAETALQNADPDPRPQPRPCLSVLYGRPADLQRLRMKARG